jgi:DNA-binding transcriptional ArsR family regulator
MTTEQPAISHPLPDELVELIAGRFHLLAEPVRIKLLDRLHEGEASIIQLTHVTNTTQQNVSKHLGILAGAGIVSRRKQGNFSYYRIADPSVFALCEVVCGALHDELETRARVLNA